MAKRLFKGYEGLPVDFVYGRKVNLKNYHSMQKDPLKNDEESLRMENEFLRLKLQAEFGADSQSTGKLNPQIENEFLKHVIAFEHDYAHAKKVKIAYLLGKADFKPANELSDEQIAVAFQKITALLAQKHIEIDFIGTYDYRTKYSFIIEELLDHEIDDINIPGMTVHICYEEFHPNHKLDIEERASEFLSGWFSQKLGHNDWCFDDAFILPDKTTITKNEIGEKFSQIFSSYQFFTDQKYTIDKIDFELNEDGGMGYAEGFVKYNAVLENSEVIIIRGPFKLYMTLKYDWWSIFHIVFPGFAY
jgi:hypothetical protein